MRTHAFSLVWMPERNRRDSPIQGGDPACLRFCAFCRFGCASVRVCDLSDMFCLSESVSDFLENCLKSCFTGTVWTYQQKKTDV